MRQKRKFQQPEFAFAVIGGSLDGACGWPLSQACDSGGVPADIGSHSLLVLIISVDAVVLGSIHTLAAIDCYLILSHGPCPRYTAPSPRSTSWWQPSTARQYGVRLMPFCPSLVGPMLFCTDLAPEARSTGWLKSTEYTGEYNSGCFARNILSQRIGLCFDLVQ